MPPRAVMTLATLRFFTAAARSGGVNDDGSSR
jgi:hypothetical protein